MQGFTYVATLLGLTLPLAIGFFVIGLIIVALVVVGGELYRENENKAAAKDKDTTAGLRSSTKHPNDWLNRTRATK